MTPRERHLLRRYGITLKQYDDLVRSANGVCEICGKEPRRTLCVDHDHKTGLIRGVLCGYCNRYVLGRLRRDQAVAIVAYLSKPSTGLVVPAQTPKKKKKKNIGKRL